jgi:hypothetical protein
MTLGRVRARSPLAQDPEGSRRPQAQRQGVCDWLRSPAVEDPAVAKCQAFFAYYLFEACRQNGLEDYLAKRLAPWWDLLAKGFTTTPENFGDTRSDAHAWGAHPVLIALEMARS